MIALVFFQVLLALILTGYLMRKKLPVWLDALENNLFTAHLLHIVPVLFGILIAFFIHFYRSSAEGLGAAFIIPLEYFIRDILAYILIPLVIFITLVRSIFEIHRFPLTFGWYILFLVSAGVTRSILEHYGI